MNPPREEELPAVHSPGSGGEEKENVQEITIEKVTGGSSYTDKS